MNEYQKIIKKFKDKLVAEGILRSFLWSLPLACFCGVVMAAVLFVVSFKELWIAIVTAIVVSAIVTVILYFVKFKATDKDVAKKVDVLGLEERVITMVELKDDTSFMAEKQREDAIKHIEKVKNTKIKLSLSKVSITLASVFTVIFIVSSTLVGISFNGGLPDFDDIITPDEMVITYNVSYLEDEGGFISGEAFQVVNEGNDASEVVAVADDGYMFGGWSDGVSTPNRIDKQIKTSVEVFAMFIEIRENEEPEQLEDERLPDDEEMDMDEMEGDPPHGAGAAGKYEEYNQVIDGNTYYRDVYKEYYDKAIDILNNGGVIPEYMRFIIEEYYNIIK